MNIANKNGLITQPWGTPLLRFKKPVSFLSIGQKVPEDIEVATKERMVDLLLNISGG